MLVLTNLFKTLKFYKNFLKTIDYRDKVCILKKRGVYSSLYRYV